MCTGKVKILLSLFVNLVFVFNNNTLSKTYTMALSSDTNELSDGLTTFAPLPEGSFENTPLTPAQYRAIHKDLEPLHEENDEIYKEIHSLIYGHSMEETEKNVLSNDDKLNEKAAKFRIRITSANSSPTFRLLSSPTLKNVWPAYVLEKSVKKRNVADENDHLKNNMSKKHQRRVEALKRSLFNNMPNENYEDVDNSLEVDDDDYSKSVNKEKIAWEDYQNKDGSTVMELFALDSRHKKHM